MRSICLEAPPELSRLTPGHNVDTQNTHENVIPLFLSCFSFNHQYEFYFPVHPNMEGDYTISITAQLGAGATAAKWKVDMFDFQGTKTWVSVGDLTGGELRSRGNSAICSHFPFLPAQVRPGGHSRSAIILRNP